MNYMQLNYLGVWTLLKKEIWRFLKVYHQTILSPIVNIILFLAVFSLSVGGKIKTIENVPFAVFMASCLIMMAAMQNAFANSSSSFVMSKVLGYFSDYLVPPIGAVGLLFAFTVGAILRGICVAIVAYLAISIFVKLSIFHFGYLVFYIIFSCMFLALLGVLCGVISETFDQMSAMTSYVITPLTFLSGTFYSTKALPDFWYNVSQYNPFFYMIDGFRYALTGYHDGDLLIGINLILVINVKLAIILYLLIKKGYRITT